MTRINYDYDADDSDKNSMKSVQYTMCKCGHKLMMHGNTMQYDYDTGENYLRVSQCIYSDKCGCKRFERK